MEYHQAVNTYIQGLVDIATILHTHHEARTEMASGFLIRAIHDGFLQPVSDQDHQRFTDDHDPQENFLLWYGDVLQQKRHWNAIGWLFPFHLLESDPVYRYRKVHEAGDVAVLEIFPNRAGTVSPRAPRVNEDLERCIALYRQGRYEEADTQWRRLLGRKPSFAESRARRALHRVCSRSRRPQIHRASRDRRLLE